METAPTQTLPPDRAALRQLEQILAQSTIPVPWANVVNLIRIADAGLQERDGFRARLAMLEGAPNPGAIPDPDAPNISRFPGGTTGGAGGTTDPNE